MGSLIFVLRLFAMVPFQPAITIMKLMNSKRIILAALLATLALGLGALPAAAKQKPAKVKIDLKNAKGESVGTAMLKQSGTSVKITANLFNLPAGDHAFHIHQNAKCEAPDFKSAGPHFNPEGRKHGLENTQGHHAGDMANFTANKKGKAKFEVLNDSVSLGVDNHSVFSNGGTALVIHAKADDGKTDPSGNAGDRIACGLIVK